MRLCRASSLLALIAIALAAVVGLSWPRPADAHAILQRSLPVQNQKLKPSETPELVETWYSEPIERSLTTLAVFTCAGKAVQQGEVVFSDADPTYAAVALPPALDPGVYTVAFENVSKVDGHIWTGSFSFIVLNQDGTTPAGSGCAPPPVKGGAQGFLPGAGDSTLRWFELLAAVAMAGALVFYLFIARPAALFLEEEEIDRVEKTALLLAADLVVIAAPVLILSAIGQILLQADRLGGPGELDTILFDTRSGELWIARIGVSAALLLLFVPALFSNTFRTGGRALLIPAVGFVGSLGLLMTYSLGSHAGTGGGEFWSVGSDFVHFVATAAWLGAMFQLPLLFWWTRGRLESSKRLLYLANAFDRYAWLAVISVTLLIGTGVFNGFVQLPNRPALWDTTYGRVLIAKLALILPLLGAAGLNAVFVSPKLRDAVDALHGDEDPDARVHTPERDRLEGRLAFLQRVLPRAISAELLLGAAVLASVAVLAQATTAKGELRQEAGRPSGQYETSSNQAGDLNVQLLVKPFGIGVSTFAVTLQPQAGAQLGDILGVRLRAFYDDPNAPPTAGRSGTDQDLLAASQPGVWSAESALLTRPGDWRIQVRIQRRAADDLTTQFSVLGVGGVLALKNQPKGLFDLPFTFADWNIVAGGAMITLGVGAFLIWRNRPPIWEGSTSASVALASIVALFAGTTLVFGIDVHQGVVPSTSPVPATEQSLAKGRSLFETNCVTCHGREGRGDGPLASQQPVPPPDLTLHVPYHNDGTLFIWVSQGIPLDDPVKRMPSFKAQLATGERWDVVNYLRHAFGSGQFTPVLPAQPTPTP